MKIITLRWWPFGRGMSLRWFVVIRKGITHLESTIEHERVHMRQQRELGFLRFLWLYFPRYWSGHKLPRQRFEAEAYAASIVHGRPYRECVYALADHHGRMGFAAAEKLIREYLPKYWPNK